jgi:hypothetical protein
MRIGLQSVQKRLLGLRCGANFPDKPCEHQFDLVDTGFEPIVLTRRQKAEVSGKQKKIVQFAGRTQRDVKILSQFVFPRPPAAFRYIGRNGKRSAPHLTRQAIPFGSWKCGCINKFPKVLHTGSFFDSRERGADERARSIAFTYNLPLMTYNCREESPPC